MAMRSEESLIDWIARALAVYSLFVYLAGLLIILSPTIVRRAFDTALPLRVRRVLVGGALAVMIVTYLAERRYRQTEEEDESGGDDESELPEYSLYARLSLAGAVIGVAIGIYVGYANERPLIGALFIFGAYLFIRMGYRHEEDRRSG